jgi:hypothetical protein
MPVCDVAEDVRTASRAWRRALDDPQGAFQLQEAAEALIGVRDAWEEDFAVYSEVLAQWCQAARAAAAGYATVDEYVAAQTLRVRHDL